MNLDKELVFAVIQYCKPKCLQRYALIKEELTLDKLLSKPKASENQAEGMEQADTSAETIQLLNINTKYN